MDVAISPTITYFISITVLCIINSFIISMDRNDSINFYDNYKLILRMFLIILRYLGKSLRSYERTTTARKYFKQYYPI
jgi:hypothetical protein